MKKIIKLTESDLTRIVKRVIIESEQQATKQQVTLKLQSCYNPSSYPRLVALAKATGFGIIDVLLAILSIFAPEFGVPGFAIFSSMTYYEIQKAVKKDKTGSIEKEANKLLKCMGIK